MNSIFQVFSFDVASKILLGLVGILLIRFMPQSEYATLTLAVSLATVVSQTIAASFNRIYIVAYQALNLTRVRASLLGLQLTGVAFLVILGLPLLNSLGKVYWFISALVVATCCSEFAKTVSQQEMRFYRFSLIEFFRSLAFLFGVAFLIYFFRYELNAEAVLLVQTAALFLVFIVASENWTTLKWSKMREVTRIANSIIRGTYKYLYAYFLLLSLFSQIDVFMLKIMGNDFQLATYGSAFRYYSMLMLVLNSVHVVFLPAVQNLKGAQELNELFAKHGRTVLLFSAAVIVIGWISQWVLPWIDLGKYPDAVIVFRILCLSAIISFAFSPHVNVIMRFERFRFLFALICVALTLSVVLNATLIPLFGAIGVAIATLITLAAVNVPVYLKSRKLTST